MNENQFAPSFYPYGDTTDMWQRRLNAMAQQPMNQAQPMMYNGYQQQGVPMNQGMNMQQAQQPRFNVRPVSSVDEAFASPAPLDGSISIMTDFSNKRIYTKKLNINDGTALMETFEKIENPKQIPQQKEIADYVKRKEFDEVKSKIDEVWNALTQPSDNSKQAKKEGK